MKLAQQETKFWNWSKTAEDEAELLLYGAVTSGVSWWSGKETMLTQFNRELEEIGDVNNITVRINSGGGEVFTAFAIYTRLRSHKASITVIIDGWAASAATIIAMAGDVVKIGKVGAFMIHNPKCSLWDTLEAKECRKVADQLDVIKNAVVEGYIAKTGMDKEEISKLMDAETWYTGEEAVKYKFCDELLFEDQLSVTNMINNGAIFVNNVEMKANNVPDKIKSLFCTAKPKPSTAHRAGEQIENKIVENKGGKEKMDFKNVEELAAACPDLVNEIRAAAATEERNRIKAIDDVILPGYEEMANKAKFEKPVSAAELSMEILVAEKKKGENYLNDLEEDVNNSNVNKAGGAAKPQNKDSFENVLNSVLPKKVK